MQGLKLNHKCWRTEQSDQFKYDESIFSLYGAITYSFSKFTLSAGLRAESSTSGLINSFDNNVFALLPNATINYKTHVKAEYKTFIQSYSQSSKYLRIKSLYIQ